MLTKRVKRFLSVAAMAPLLLTACDSNPFDPFEEGVGTYDLSVFAGRAVPAEFDCNPGECGMPNGGTFRVNSGTLTLHQNGTFVEVNQFTETENGQGSQNSTFTSSGTYEINGEELTLDDPVQGRFINGTLEFTANSVRINYNEGGDSYEYLRR